MSARALAAAALMGAIVAGGYMLGRGYGVAFGLTFVLALVGVTIALFWPALIAGGIAYVLLRVALRRARKQGARRRWGS